MLNVKNINVNSIKIRNASEDLGDLSPLMNSLQKFGQITPIMITISMNLSPATEGWNRPAASGRGK